MPSGYTKGFIDGKITEEEQIKKFKESYEVIAANADAVSTSSTSTSTSTRRKLRRKSGRESP